MVDYYIILLEKAASAQSHGFCWITKQLFYLKESIGFIFAPAKNQKFLFEWNLKVS